MAAPSDVNTILSPIDAKLNPWNTTAAPAITFTYQFAGTSQPSDLPFGTYSGWTAFTQPQKDAIKSVLDEFASVMNVKFVEVTGQADPDINFGRVNLSGEAGQGGWKYSYTTNSSGQVTSKTYDGFAVFLNTVDLTTLDSRNLILHEIGHALMLKHPGNYDAGGQPVDGPFIDPSKDSNKITVMSYTVDPDNGLKSDHLMTYDIAALQQRWGANTATATGNNIYTGPSSGRIQTIWDAGGTDPFDGSAISTGVNIDLREGQFSSLGALNNLAIAYGVVIENATGGAGNDTFYVNSANNVIKGNAGIDTVIFSGTKSSYTLTATPGGVIVSGPQGTDTLLGVEKLAFTDQTVTWDPNAVVRPLTHDFNGDGTSDIFWRNNLTGHTGIWEMRNNVLTWKDLGGSGADHKVVGSGDFNNDHTSDIFWRNDDTGHTGIWEMHNSVQTWHDLGRSGVEFKVVGVGDFNGDGTSDVFWRNDSDGHVGIWEMHDFVQTWRDLGMISGVDHKVVGVGDFNGDGTSDILWRNNDTGHVGIWEMHNNVQTWHDLGGSGVDHKVVGVGDFNGDGTSDILWRNNDTGHVGIWEMHNFVSTWHDLGGSGADHKVVSVGYFNNDNTSDIFWRYDATGHTGIWEMHNFVQTWIDLGGSGADHVVVA